MLDIDYNQNWMRKSKDSTSGGGLDANFLYRLVSQSTRLT